MKRIALLLLLAAVPAHAQDSLEARVRAALAAAGPGPRYGLVVADEAGREIVAIDPDGRYIPASNTKMFTTAAAFATLPALDQPDRSGGAAVRLAARDGDGAPDVVLIGHGDARLSSAPNCASDCLASLADAVAAQTRRVHDVIGDDTAFPWERWSPGMSWNNIPTRSGTATSALTLDDNELALTVTPTAPGQPPRIEGDGYFTIQNAAMTVAAAGPSTLDIDRAPDSRLVRVTGTIAAGAAPELVRGGIDDPAEHAAFRFRQLLEARGVKVSGAIGVRHRLLAPSDDPALRKGAPAPRVPEQPVLAQLVPPPLEADLVHTNKVSQNLHAELALRRVSLAEGSGSIADGLVRVRAMLAGAGLPRAAYDFSDGSGMSTYNRISPRGAVQFLRWVAAQPWGARWRATLPTSGEGTLARRFASVGFMVYAKTGTLNATNALSGYIVTRGGRTLTFSALANDVPDDVRATKAVDAALAIVAESPLP